MSGAKKPSAAKKKPRGGVRRAGVNADCHLPAQSTTRNTVTEGQRDRILRALRRRPQTTEDLRKLGVFQAPARVKELRDRFGYEIQTTRVTVVDREGFSHPRAALYSLSEEQKGAVR